MPELPEVETTARILRPELCGRAIVAVRGLDYPPLVEPLAPDGFAAAVAGRRIREVGRRGKHLMLQLDNGAVLAIHLRMSGRLLLTPRDVLPDRHTHLVLDLDDGKSLHFRDPRKFGRARYIAAEQYADWSARLGPEPLDSLFTAEYLAARLRARPRARLKALLLDQRFLAGLGNIYTDEALFRAGLHPLRAAGTLSLKECGALHQAIVQVLGAAILANGTTLGDGIFLFGADEAGRFAERLAVYGRGGQPCPVCGAALARQIIAGRSSHFCPVCQS